MVARRTWHTPCFVVEHDQSLVGVPMVLDSREMTQYSLRKTSSIAFDRQAQ